MPIRTDRGQWQSSTDGTGDLVRSGQLSLTFAQHIEATNWVAASKVCRRDCNRAGRLWWRRRIWFGRGSGGGGAGGNCTAGYAPCLPDHGGADYDCYGGGGNGPYYTQPGVTYTVTGSDPYGLDSNGDGKACC